MSAPLTPGPSAENAPRNPVLRYLARFDDGEVVRWAFRGLLIGTIAVLALDVYDLAQRDLSTASADTGPVAPEPLLPPAVTIDGPPAGEDPRRFVTGDDETLRRPMQFVLEGGGLLRAEGTIVPGTAARLAAELEARGEYVRTVAFNSPGGALDDAIAIADLLRRRNVATTVEAGALCASSCPLAFAGGTVRGIDPEAAVGVHQFYAAAETKRDPAQVMADAQMTTARIARHLAGMGIDAGLWLHALDTPPRALYYLSSDEQARYRLVTPTPKTAARK